MKILSRCILFCLFILLILYGCRDNDATNQRVIEKNDKTSESFVNACNWQRQDHSASNTADTENILRDLQENKWSQVIEGKELAHMNSLLKDNQEISPSIDVQKKARKRYDITIRYYDGERIDNISIRYKTLSYYYPNTVKIIENNPTFIKDIGEEYCMNPLGQFVKEDGNTLVIKKEDNNHIVIQKDDGPVIRFFKTPQNIDEIYGNWEPVSSMGDKASVDLVNWKKPKRVSMEDLKYSLKLYKTGSENDRFNAIYNGINGQGANDIMLTFDNENPVLSAAGNSFHARYNDKDIKRSYILNYNPLEKTITTLIWNEDIDPQLKRVLQLNEYSDKFLKIEWKKR